jgi:tetratricopeptide (TPR) repeat protein
MRQLPYNATANRAVERFNAGDMAAAKTLAARAAQIMDKAPHAHHLLGNIAIKEQNYREAITHLEAAIAQSEGDSTLAEVRSNAMDNLAVLVANEAATATGDEQKALAAKAAGYYRDILARKPNDVAAQSGLAQTLQLSGDSTAVAGIYSSMSANPGQYTSNQLMDAGIGAANAGRTDDAITLLTAGLKDNPYYRDGLFALSIMYLNAGKFDSLTATANRLVSVDPSNPDNHALLAQAYEGLVSTATDNKIKRTYADSMLKTQQRASRMPVRVTFTEFQNMGNDQRVLNGSVENLTDAPANYVLKVEFLDKAGNVVATKEEAVSEVQGKGSKTFSISVQQAGAVAFRYAPITS